MKGLFITGTDTGVGKTAVLTALLGVVRKSGGDAVPMKPVQTGCRATAAGLISPDLALVLRTVGFQPDPAEERWMCPYRFKPACSPHLAAARARVGIRTSRILWAFRMLAARHSVVFAEGAGGLLVPLNQRDMMLDLMKALGLPVVIAARPGLGTLNHSLLALREARRAGLHVLGLVLVCTRPGRWGRIEQNNLETLRRLGRLPVHRMSWIPNLGKRRGLPARTLREAADWLTAWGVNFSAGG